MQSQNFCWPTHMILHNIIVEDERLDQLLDEWEERFMPILGRRLPIADWTPYLAATKVIEDVENQHCCRMTWLSIFGL